MGSGRIIILANWVEEVPSECNCVMIPGSLISRIAAFFMHSCFTQVFVSFALLLVTIISNFGMKTFFRGVILDLQAIS